MKYKPYEFNPDHAYDFARSVGIQAKAKGDELQFLVCPYCRGGGKRDKGSFAINLRTGAYKCLRESCGAKGNMITLSKDFEFSLGNEVDEYYAPKKRFKALKTPTEPIVPKDTAIEFLKSRGISEKVAEKYQITSHKDKDDVLVFPFFDEKGILQFVKYRKTNFDKAKDKCKEWCEADCKPILFGMNVCSHEDKTLIVTEGQMDTLAVATAYDCNINVVSVPTGSKGFTWIPYCWNWLHNFEKIIIFGDCEKGHITLLDDFAKRMKTKIYHVREEDYKGKKDANEILIEFGNDAIKNAIQNAIQIPLNQVIELADVKPISAFDVEKLQTGIHQVDKLLYGGIPFGGLTLLSGKAGEGKSTLASQVMVNALEQGYCCFAYSGELSNDRYRDWMDFQVAGRTHISEYTNHWGDTNYKLSDTNREMISEWYRGRFYMFDNSSLDGEETQSLCKLVEDVILQYGVRVILLDNLMTALDLETTSGNDKYERQSNFVKKLSRLALKYNVLIILVAHKRKNNFSTNENDEIMGASDIGNLAMVVLAYEKSSEIEDGQRLCKVSKNRLFGKTNTQGWVLNYDDKSKRIYGLGDDIDVVYGWDTTSNGFITAEDITMFE